MKLTIYVDRKYHLNGLLGGIIRLVVKHYGGRVKQRLFSMDFSISGLSDKSLDTLLELLVRVIENSSDSADFVVGYSHE